MSALEKFSTAPRLTRPLMRALPQAHPIPVASQSGFEALARLAARLLPDSIVILYHEDPESEMRVWPDGIMGRRTPIEPLARSLCAAATSGPELQIASLPRHRRFGTMPGVQDAGPLAFASVPLPGAGLTGVLGVLRGEGPWSDDETLLMRDLATSFVHEYYRERLRERAAELEETANRTELRYRRLLASSAPAILSVDRATRITEVSEAGSQILDRQAHELVGVHARHVLRGSNVRATWAALRAVLNGETSGSDLEIQITRATGEKRTLSLVIEPTLADGKVSGARAIARDITEDRVRETQLRLTERVTTIAPLLSGVCHELNNPLTSIKSFAELLLLDARSPDDREALEIVQREAHRAARIVGDLRMIALQSQEAAMQRDLIDLNALVRKVVAGRMRELAAQGVEVREELAAELPPTRAVREHLEQVVTQLVSNALKAMEGRDAARILTLATYRSGHGVSVVVRDTGRGIAPEHLSRIFDPFWTTRLPGEGTGLGLSLVHSIVSSHGGRIVPDSQLGRGSAMTVDLPIADEVPPEVVICDDRSASRGLRVLVVDDEAPIRFSVARYLERRGHEVHQAADGNVALQMIEAAAGELSYDIVIADLRMPGLDGESLLACVRQRYEGLEHRLIFMTGDAQSPAAVRLLQESGIPVMWKPFELAEVAQIIETQARLLMV